VVLLLEDDDAVRRVTARILRSHGFEVAEARTVAQARSAYAEHRSRVILLITDIVMPDLSGPQFAAELAQEGQGLRTLYMSGYSGGVVSGQMLPPGAALLPKPFTATALVEKVREVLKA
jgi:DNA-binding NtrC family response regulator